MSAADPSKKHRTKSPYHVMIKSGGPICNIDCDYCYYLEKTELFPGEKRFRMDYELLEQFIRSYIASHPGPTIVFPWHGGEPTMLGIEYFEYAVELQKKYLPQGWTCINVPQTNGTLLDEDWCRFFKDNDFAIGISIDGPQEFHDAFRPDKRGKGTHARVMQSLGLLQKFHVPYTVLCTVNSVNAKAPLTIYKYFRDQGVTALQFLPIVKWLGEGRVSKETVPPAAYGEFLVTIFNEWLRRDFGRVWVQIFEEALMKVRGDPGSLCLFQETCGDSLALEHNGDLFACDHYVTEEYKLGNIRTRTMKSLVESQKIKQFARAKRDTLPSQCLNCDVRFMCNGGCPKDRHLKTRDGEDGLNFLCAGYMHFFRHAKANLEYHIIGKREQSRTAEDPAPETALPSQPSARPGRNDPCSCGSGRKFKRCCGIAARA